MPPVTKKKIKKRLGIYYNKRNRCKTQFRCKNCDKVLTCQQFDDKDHAAECLGLDIGIQCVWCEGNASWQKYRKSDNVNHLLECFNVFISKIRRPVPLSSSLDEGGLGDGEMATAASALEYDIRMDNLEHTCEVGYLFGRTRVLTDPRAYYYYYDNNGQQQQQQQQQSFYPLVFDENYSYDLYRDENLNFADKCVKLYLEKTHEFNHCMVRAAAFDSFIEAVEADGGGRARILPFSCWCDGGTSDLEDFYRHHRHMIIVYPLFFSEEGEEEEENCNFNKNVWSKITIEDRPYSNYKCRFMKPIESALHLINTIGYVSNRQSRCSGAFDKKNKSRSGREYQKKHFCIFASLPGNFRLPLVMQWEGGMVQLIDQTHKFNGSPQKFWGAPSLRKIDGMWYIKVKDLPDIPKGIVLPVRKNVRFVFEDEMTEQQQMMDEVNRVLFRMDGNGNRRRIRAVRDDSLEKLEHEEWLAKQAERGLNLFWDGFGEEKWKCNDGLQKNIEVWRIQQSKHERMMQKKETEYKRSLEEKEMECKRILEKNESLIKIKHEEELARFKIKHEEELSSMKEQYDRAMNENRNEMGRMRMKLYKLQREIKAKNEEISKLSHNITINNNISLK